MIFNIGSIIKTIAILITVAIVAGGLWYISNLKANLAVSEMNNQTLQNSIKEQHALIEKMQKDIKDIQKINSEINKFNEELKKDTENLAKKFNSKDIGVLAAEKPSLVEKLINRGTENAMRCLELASGAPLTEQEKKKTPSEANRECPNLINPAYTTTN
jgi:predicted nuclease with TOPRIM domain